MNARDTFQPMLPDAGNHLVFPRVTEAERQAISNFLDERAQFIGPVNPDDFFRRAAEVLREAQSNESTRAPA